MQIVNSIKHAEILLVEDNPGDARLCMEAIKDAKIKNTIHTVTDGVQAMQFLRKAPPYEDAIRPDLILLDLNMPKKDGREVLAEVKKDPELCMIPVVVMTTSESDKDIARSYALHANCYVVKPVDIYQFSEVVNSIENFWFSIVKLPPR